MVSTVLGWTCGYAGSTGLTLGEAVSMALKRNHEYRQLLDSTVVAELDLERARSVFRSRISSSMSSESRLGSEFGSTYNLGISRKLPSGSRLEAGFITSDFSNITLSEFRVRYTRPLFADPERSGQLALDKVKRQARHMKRLGILAAEELAAKIIKIYYLALRDREAVRIQEGIVQIVTATARAVEARQARGLASVFDKKKVQLELASAQQTRRELESRLQDRLDQLIMMLGLNIGDEVSFDLDLVLDVPPPAGVEEIPRLQKQAIQARVEILAGQEMLDEKYRRMHILSGRRGAPIDISLQYSVVGQGGSFGDSLAIDDQRIGFGLSLNTDLGLAEQKIDDQLAVLDYRRSVRDFERLKEEVRLEIRNAVRGLVRRHDALRIAEEQSVFAEQLFEYTRARYNKGLSDALELLKAQQEMAATRHQRLVAVVDAIIARLGLDMSTGRLRERWDLDLPE